MPNELIPMSTWTPHDGQTYEIVDAEAREELDGKMDYMSAITNLELEAMLNFDAIPFAEEEEY